mmetsp:Transcript_8441/g.16412  ORF Transcript_8441/g.16412 Transcript_8441/m.16412 type:complete len:264 (+) Transcript_8441:321-1112(+)
MSRHAKKEDKKQEMHEGKGRWRYDEGGKRRKLRAERRRHAKADQRKEQRRRTGANAEKSQKDRLSAPKGRGGSQARQTPLPPLVPSLLRHNTACLLLPFFLPSFSTTPRFPFPLSSLSFNLSSCLSSFSSFLLSPHLPRLPLVLPFSFSSASGPLPLPLPPSSSFSSSLSHPPLMKMQPLPQRPSPRLRPPPPPPLRDHSRVWGQLQAPPQVWGGTNPQPSTMMPGFCRWAFRSSPTVPHQSISFSSRHEGRTPTSYRTYFSP